MIKYAETTVFNVNAQTIVNAVNCVGVMGAGLALEFKLRFPEMERDYVERCKNKSVNLGKPYLYKNYENPWILNFPTKNNWKYPSKLEWIEDGLSYFVKNYKKGGITSIAFPKLGCDKGGLDWVDVSLLMEKYLKDLDVEVIICLDKEQKASGIEGVMVDLINSYVEKRWSELLNVRSSIEEKIIKSLPLRRFRNLGKIEGVGKQTYIEMFKFFYSRANEVCNSASVLGVIDSGQKNTHVSEGFFEKNEDVMEGIFDKENKKDVVLLNEKCTEEEYRFKEDEGKQQFDAFNIMLPYIEKALEVELTKEELSELFGLPKNLVGNWLEKAEELGKIKKLLKPIRYISKSSSNYKQLEYDFLSSNKF